MRVVPKFSRATDANAPSPRSIAIMPRHLLLVAVAVAVASFAVGTCRAACSGCAVSCSKLGHCGNQDCNGCLRGFYPAYCGTGGSYCFEQKLFK